LDAVDDESSDRWRRVLEWVIVGVFVSLLIGTVAHDVLFAKKSPAVQRAPGPGSPR
jgi:hypothetical protein